MHTRLQTVSGPNAFTLRIPVPSALNISEWRSRLHNYSDPELCDFLEFGWPVSYVSSTPPVSSQQNHGSALSSPQIIESFLDTECHLGATRGPFITNRLRRFGRKSPSNRPQSLRKTSRRFGPQIPLRLLGQQWYSFRQLSRQALCLTVTRR